VPEPQLHSLATDPLLPFTQESDKRIGADLNTVIGQGVDFGRAVFQRADLLDADLSGANLAGADFRKADLRRTWLTEAIVTPATGHCHGGVCTLRTLRTN
jgi:hypothetical protein